MQNTTSRSRTVKVAIYDEGRRQFRCPMIGGQRPWVGTDQEAADLAVLRIQQLYERQGKEWTEDGLRDLEVIVAAFRSGSTQVGPGTTGPTSPVVPPPTSKVLPQQIVPKPVSSLTLHDAIKIYSKQVQAGGALSESGRIRRQVTVSGLVARLESLRQYAPQLDLGTATYDSLELVVGKLAARPLSARTGKPISAVFASSMISALRQLLDWLEASERWDGPRRWLRLFRGKTVRALTTKVEVQEQHERRAHFTVEELRTIYHCGSLMHRLLILTALNCGATQMELATLRWSEIKDGKIRRLREKTSVLGQWELWPETARLLQLWRRAVASMEVFTLAGLGSTIDPDEIVFINRCGNPLVYFSKKGLRHDTVICKWAELLRKIRIAHPQFQGLSFKALRKTGSQWVRDCAQSQELTQAYLSHAEQSISGRHYNHRTNATWAALDVVMRRVYQEKITHIIDGAPAAGWFYTAMERARQSKRRAGINTRANKRA